MTALAIRTFFSLLAVLGIFLLVFHYARKGRIVRGGAAINVSQRQPVGRASSVAVVEADGRRFLVGVTEQNIRLLTELSSATPMTGALLTDPAVPTGTVAGPALENVTQGDGVATEDKTAVTLSGRHRAAYDPSKDVPSVVSALSSAPAAPAASVTADGGAAELFTGLFAGEVARHGAHDDAQATPARVQTVDAAPQPSQAFSNGGPLEGSVLSPRAWKQAWTGIRERGGRNRPAA